MCHRLSSEGSGKRLSRHLVFVLEERNTVSCSRSGSKTDVGVKRGNVCFYPPTTDIETARQVSANWRLKTTRSDATRTSGLSVLNSNFLRMKEDHRSPPSSRQRFDHPHFQIQVP